MKTVLLNYGETDLEIDFDLIEAEDSDHEYSGTPETVCIHKIRLAENGWDQDCIPNKDISRIKEMLLDSEYEEIFKALVKENLFKLFGEILNPTKNTL